MNFNNLARPIRSATGAAWRLERLFDCGFEKKRLEKRLERKRLERKRLEKMILAEILAHMIL